MMREQYCLDETEWKRAKAELVLAQRLGLIGDAGIPALEARRHAKNAENERKKENGVIFYGPERYTSAMYLQYELTRFRLDFVQPCAKVRRSGACPDFTEDEKRTFYEKNQDLFGRYDGDLFAYGEVAQIIEKRLREEAYDKLIQDILCESADRQGYE